ncbi:hypothetical protein [Marixanthomonas spongiae]|uniref:Uncharacterized protein n=1 Tax=Marixanthomonas spongiae TaxID=2174845 RepID=A0A2U0HWE2_9FLAO|nr:hypothetical protein [Marixanthomonas spongiae]PVW13174.1 hypothetical protein DDV96_13785 [Marixanthomonas spongiae]
MKKIYICLLLLLCTTANNYAQEIDQIYEVLKKKADKRIDSLKQEPIDEDEFLQYRNCLGSIAYYVHQYRHLESKIDNADDCFKKYDLYGVQELMLLNSTSIMYCTEDLWNKFNSSDTNTSLKNLTMQTHLLSYIKNISRIYQYDEDSLNEMEYYIAKVFQSPKNMEDDTNELLYYLTNIQYILKEYFHPITVMAKALEINKTMEALPCSDGVHR